LLAVVLLPQGASASERAGATVYLTNGRTDDSLISRHELDVGTATLVRTAYSVKRVSVANPEVADVVVLTPREINLVAKSTGTTNVLFWDPKGKLQAALEVNVGAPRSHLESVIARALPGEDIHIETAGGALVLTGTATRVVAMQQALDVARASLGEESDSKVVNLINVSGNNQVMIDLVFAEMSRSLTRELGVNGSLTLGDGLPRQFSIANLLPFAFGSQATLAGQVLDLGNLDLQFALSILQEKGLSKVLAQPTVVARSGESASFLVGGELPIPIAQGGAFGSISIEFKPFGVGVEFTPTVLADDRIHLRISPEVSEPDVTQGATIAGQFVPAFVTRRTSTAVELANGQSFAIAGLISDKVKALSSRYPVLGDIPVLGALFRSNQYIHEETELVMIATPRLVKPLGEGPHPLPTDHQIEPTDYEFYMEGLLEGRLGQPGQRATAGNGGLIGPAGHHVSSTETLEEDAR
jgi:pilus assembly protein CpaC